MARGWRRAILWGGPVAVLLIAWQMRTPAQQAEAPRTRFEFQVIQSYDAKYLGDTEGHLGKGSIPSGKPDVSLGDPVYRGNAKVGTVTGLLWDRNKESLEVEFDPDPYELDLQGRATRRMRIAVGQDVWIPLGGDVGPLPGR